MTINTRYEPGEDVHCLFQTKLGWRIAYVNITSVTWEGNSIMYGGSGIGKMIPEEDCFPTYEEAHVECAKRNEGTN